MQELKHKLLGQDPREREQELASAPSDMYGDLGPVGSTMSGGHSMMSMRERPHMHSSFMGGGASGTAFSMSPSHSLMGPTGSVLGAVPSMGGGRAGVWQAERTSSGQANRKMSHTPHKSSQGSRAHGQHAHSAHHGQHGHSGQRGGGANSHTSRLRGSHRRGTGGSAPIVQRAPDGRPTNGTSRPRHRTHTLGAPMQQQHRHHRHHRSSRSTQQRGHRSRKSGAEGKALLELDQALNALQNAVKPAKKSSQRRVRPSNPRMSTRGGAGRSSRSHRSQAQQPSVAEAHAKVLSAIDSRLRAASALLANAGKPKPKPTPKDSQKEETAQEENPTVEVLENDSGVLPIPAADGCVEGPRAERTAASDGSSSAGELSFTLPAAQSSPQEDPRQTLQLAGFQWLYTSDDQQSAEALRESIADVQRQIKENPEIVAQAAAAAMDPGGMPEGDAGAAGTGGAIGDVADGAATSEEDAQRKNAYAVVAALVATVRAEAAAEAERRGSNGYASSDDGEDELAGEESQLHDEGASEEASEAGSDVGSYAGSVMEFASAAGDSSMLQGGDSVATMDTLNMPASAMHAPDNLLSMHDRAVVEEADESDEQDLREHGEPGSSAKSPPPPPLV